MTTNLKSLLIFSFLLSFVGVSYGQTGNSQGYDDRYFDERQMLIQFEAKATENIASKPYLNLEDARVQLKEAVNKKAVMPKVKPRKKVLSAPEVHQLVKESAVAMGLAYDCGNCDKTHINHSSGYIISEDGLCATNYHVVESFTNGDLNLSMQIMLTSGEVYPVVEIISADQEADLAIIRVDTGGDKLTPLPLGDPANVGDDVFVLSNPNRMLFYFSKGIVARNYIRSPERRGEKGMPEMEITADYSVGSSGAPIVDNKGNLVSTVSTTRSIYVNAREQKNLQMVVKGTKPVVLLNDMIEFK